MPGSAPSVWERQTCRRVITGDAMLRIDVEGPGFVIEQVEQAAGLLEAGGIGVIPTDTVYGLCALATDRVAVEKVFRIKGRPLSKPLPLQVSGKGQAGELAVIDGPQVTRLMDAFWPGPLTLILPKRRDVDLPWQDSPDIGLRVPDCPFCLALLERVGWLVVPSANFSGAEPPVSFADVDAALLEAVDFAVQGGACPIGIESTVVSVTAGLEVLREGAIPSGDIMGAAG